MHRMHAAAATVIPAPLSPGSDSSGWRVAGFLARPAGAVASIVVGINTIDCPENYVTFPIFEILLAAAIGFVGVLVLIVGVVARRGGWPAAAASTVSWLVLAAGVAVGLFLVTGGADGSSCFTF